ncbi:hypothetical protein EMIHUDRAFT_233148 [Emiliania huxleyi CCMP1516]|uniref:Uncharacterized protein n=2 Tax=Emiliania huxleyi TaxID=2903 RepID=A0A0D3K362_EMIH1|nr:hypothetical protein EMIHUDRAFT_233148 [Emiliania huxleyi CCMP1516]EOD30197.1 hypothetical protein EMIHUDRAFT_233148 [Emiliania huxleyi CCMP1516]|eukprot:XP_005782626.1 hypothetical protein EMIHUDRAFT_233148 [Emiliania huxleyi CCMP1516]
MRKNEPQRGLWGLVEGLSALSRNRLDLPTQRMIVLLAVLAAKGGPYPRIDDNRSCPGGPHKTRSALSGCRGGGGCADTCEDNQWSESSLEGGSVCAWDEGVVLYAGLEGPHGYDRKLLCPLCARSGTCAIVLTAAASTSAPIAMEASIWSHAAAGHVWKLIEMGVGAGATVLLGTFASLNPTAALARVAFAQLVGKAAASPTDPQPAVQRGVELYGTFSKATV